MADRVLITGARAASALDLARDFHAAGWEVHMADCTPARISRWSRAVQRLHRYPSPVREPQHFRQRVLDLVDQVQPRLILPTCEEAFHLAAPALQDRLDACLFQPHLPRLRQLHDKHGFALLLAELGLPVPETHLITNKADLARFAGDSSAWVFKPCFSRFGEAALIGPAPARLHQIDILPGLPWIAQRKVTGMEASFYAVARDGQVTAFAAYHSDWRLKGGASIAFAPLSPAQHAMLLGFARRLAVHGAISGQLACDVMIDAAGQAWLIECNPRATSGVHFLAGQGDLARAIAGTASEPALAEPGQLHLLPAMLSFGLANAIQRGRLKPWIAALRTGQDAIGRAGDRRPMLGALVDGCAFALAGLRHGQSTSTMTTADIEWNGESLA
ncbi:hypothetical protein GRI97_02890 [Altererythrobacter xixiisoli]|uniref:ATP-grasp domain-containing protein n=1 Tax=Croceibacterium xixiisoli TaxID=1476466 RepID=A0A6I4TPC6_9SPHN|nr:hypothetical protein [Croceibacterium xixiisoli]MXO97935.1 hypothetical protein [Croceibacterium xixiisoli]